MMQQCQSMEHLYVTGTETFHLLYIGKLLTNGLLKLFCTCTSHKFLNIVLLLYFSQPQLFDCGAL